MKKIHILIFIALTVLLYMTGCGGGGSTSPAVTTTIITGTISATANISLNRSGAATGLVGKPTVSVNLYAIDDSGTKSGSTLATAISTGSGIYTITLPAGVNFASNLVVVVGNGANQMRSIVTSTSVNINPTTELVVSKIIASSQPLSSFTVSEIIAIQAQVDTDAASTSLSTSATVTDAVATLNSGQLATNLDTMVASAGAGTFTSGCGNSIIESGETCDDGNTTVGDGCSSTCITESSNDGWDDWDDEPVEEDALANIMETTFITIDNVSIGTVTAGSPVRVTAALTLTDDEEEATITSVTLSYSLDGGALNTVTMINDTNLTWSAYIPAQSSGVKVDFFITAIDSNDNMTTGSISSSSIRVSGVPDMNNSEDIVGDDTDLIGMSAGYDSEKLYVNFDVEGEISGGIMEPPFIILYGIKITNPDISQGEGLMVGNLWIHAPLMKNSESGLSILKLITSVDENKFPLDERDKIIETGNVVLDLQKLMNGNTEEGILTEANPQSVESGNLFEGNINIAALGANPSGYLRIITLTAANASIDSFIAIPLNFSNFLTLYTSSYGYTVQ